MPALLCAGLAGAGIAQTVAGWLAARAFATAPRPPAPATLPAITVLKPLHGDEPLLEQALETFFALDYPDLQLVFGVARADDPACGVVRRLIARHPGVAADLVIDATQHGANRKIGNLINMLPLARHATLVISDSDMHVAPDYLRQVAAALAQPGVGLVTSLYTGRPAEGSATQLLGAAHINQIFASGQLMARHLGRQDCVGATMALSRETLDRVGGLAGLVDYVADDGILGRRVRGLGLTVALAPTVPATTVGEETLAALFRHELRWARTIRAMAPTGFFLSCVQYPFAWAVLALLVDTLIRPGMRWPALLVALVALLRIACGRDVERALGATPTPAYLTPLRDIASLAVWACAFGGSRVAWRGHTLSTEPDRALIERDGAFISAPPVLAPREG